MKAIANKNNSMKLNKTYIKTLFLTNVNQGNQYCDCKSLSNTGIFPSMNTIVKKECECLCGGNTLEVKN
jgi:hypothetical protein